MSCVNCIYWERTENRFLGYCPLNRCEMRSWETCDSKSLKPQQDSEKGFPTQNPNPSPLPPLQRARFPKK